MAEITAKMVRDLREQSGAGMMDCKKALAATEGDQEAAFDHLRKQGLKAAEKKAGRSMGEGRVCALVSDDGRSGAMIAVSCETDFVAKTPDFESFLADLSKHVLREAPEGVEQLAEQRWEGSDDRVGDVLKAVIGKLGENISIVEVQRLENASGRVQAYIHHDQKKGALVSVETEADGASAAGPLRDLCMHIVVFNPSAPNRDGISEKDVERERAIYLEEVKSKPENIQEKIIAGKLEKFFAATVLSEQPWMRDDKQTVQKALEGSLGAGTKIVAFSRFQVGD